MHHGAVARAPRSVLVARLPARLHPVQLPRGAPARGVDVRTVGSGNVGATNVMRSAGKAAGLAAFALDFAKGVAGDLAGPARPSDGHACPASRRRSRRARPHVPGVARVPGRQGRGHRRGRLPAHRAPWPPWARWSTFARGRSPSPATSSLGSIAGGASLAVARVPHRRAARRACARRPRWRALIVWKHRENLRRLAAGTERRMGAPRGRGRRERRRGRGRLVGHRAWPRTWPRSGHDVRLWARDEAVRPRDRPAGTRTRATCPASPCPPLARDRRPRRRPRAARRSVLVAVPSEFCRARLPRAAGRSRARARSLVSATKGLELGHAAAHERGRGGGAARPSRRRPLRARRSRWRWRAGQPTTVVVASADAGGGRGGAAGGLQPHASAPTPATTWSGWSWAARSRT